MLWIILALILALPVLLGLVLGTDAPGAQRLVLRCCIAGGFVGLLASGFLILASPNLPLGATLALPVLPRGGHGCGYRAIRHRSTSFRGRTAVRRCSDQDGARAV
jgi:hypothetical protein